MTIPEAMAKYRRKLLFVRLNKKLREIQEWVNRNRVAAQTQVNLMQEKIRGVLDREGVYTDLHSGYLAYAAALDKTQKEMRFMVDLIREHAILRDRFERRNLDPEILDKIDELVIYRTAGL